MPTGLPRFDRPTLFCLHALGSSARAFEPVAGFIREKFDIVAIDLPGFGDAPAGKGVTVEAMADHVSSVVAARGPARWLLLGHSMGGKIATIVAARAMKGEPGLFGLAGVVLLAGSPPSPEPMDEARRQSMLAWTERGGLDDAAAREFIQGNTGSALPPDLDALARADLKRTTREAWRAWLERGSREDWREAVGTLDVPALILAGGEDGDDLGEKGQRRENGPIYPRAKVLVLEGAGHLLPLERPLEVAEAISAFWRDAAGLGPVPPVDFARMIASDRVSRRTRAILAARAVPDDPNYLPKALNGAQLETLRAVTDRVVPQEAPRIDLAARVDAQLAADRGDGWRIATMPPDAEAYRAALDVLEGFGGRCEAEQDALLQDIAAERFDVSWGTLSPAQMAVWFEDARTDLVRQWLAHPATMARIGFDGFANGGDGARKQGFERLAAGEREAWEPAMELAR
ncbi:alpha/beta hydrolase [Aureimonas psammosilenae]|uniref:alpha/beta hydrolase n=1 Tax=Aureimonas psammosilenae TaxID=2495496 RepID=UPI001AED8061|nr:alpha/beta hydrolase [Aureimonas psammosilenae]